MKGQSDSAMHKVISEIRSYVERLLAERKQLHAELSARDEAMGQLKERLNEYEHRIAELEDTTKTLKIAKSLTGAGENTDAKLKINELVREIDKCISLLNT